MGYHEMAILLVEDSTDDAELIKRVLLSLNLKNNIIWLKDGQEVLDYVFCEGDYEARRFEFKPRLILLDLKLPKLSGIEVLEILKSNPDTHNIPVVMMTSSRENNDLKKCYELGANSYVIKPIDYKDFIKATEKVGLYWLLTNENL